MQGSIQSTSVSTDMAINGNGWFVVEQPTGITDNQPQFNGVNYYTRAGDFQLNQNGYLVNGAGYYLMGIPIDPTTGNPVGSVPQVLQFDNNFVPAQATTDIQYQANLPSTPKSGMLNPNDFEANPLAGAPIAAQITGTGATLEPDAAATGTGTVAGLPPHDAHRSDHRRRHLHHQRRHQYDDLYGDRGRHGRQPVTAINGGSRATSSASLNASGNLVLTGTDASRPSRSPSAAPPPPTLGFGAGAEFLPADQSVDPERGGAGPDA